MNTEDIEQKWDADVAAARAKLDASTKLTFIYACLGVVLLCAVYAAGAYLFLDTRPLAVTAPTLAVTAPTPGTTVTVPVPITTITTIKEDKHCVIPIHDRTGWASVKIGMTDRQVLAVLCSPDTINITERKDYGVATQYEQWVYGYVYLYFDNGLLRSIQR